MPKPALIKVDAYPKTILKGHVKFVDTVASAPDVFAGNVKVYKTLASMDLDKAPAKPMKLLPGMSAEVTIEADRKTGVVRVPTQAVGRVGEGCFCYVKAGAEILKREVVPGFR